MNQTTHKLLALTLTAALLAAAPSWAQSPKEGGDKKVTVPFQLLLSNHMVVRAKVNGKGPYRFVFDLGAPITLLSNRAAEDSGTIKENAPRSFLLNMRGEAEVKSLEIGDLKTEKLPVVVFDHPILKALGDFLGRPLDGIMGYTFFARYKTTIDYQARRMTFEPVNAKIRNLMQDLQARLAGPKEQKHRVLAPSAFWGLNVGAPSGGVSSRGVPVTAVWPDTPAADAGLKAGDIVSVLDGRWTASVADVYAATTGVSPGRAVEVVVLRDGKELTLTVTPRAGL
ncbi:MAG: PDZ domain-containing protein [Isosphaeraceae bacterium]|nr:PDZ domain-containing protein [Isosphaeraceae bacterium]